MAKLYYHYATMNAGKSSLLLQANHNYTSQGMRTFLISSALDHRSGTGMIRSRLGIEAESFPATVDHDLFAVVRDAMESKDDARELRCVFVDEAQFLKPAQVEQLTRIVDQLGVPVMAYGLRTDFRGELFPGSEALFRYADEIREARSVCWCGSRATMILRTDEAGNVVKDGEQIVVGGDDMYTSVCRKHWASGDTGSA